ncbi:MAG: Asp-tRNA(Asn)/Glu-tRNA(Gln) amidotransferase subunit GatA [Tissierellia bacterium]|nr:Asp-tRNA(Asn)/Glu-tRNA(Gln) amidotransferase subunit GatA [Tissierellia bacterium]
MNNILKLKAWEQAQLLEQKDISAYELVKKYYENIEINKDLNAFISLRKEKAITEAKAIDEKRAKGENLSKIAGLCLALKDNISIKDEPMTCASGFMKDYIAPFNSSVYEQLKSADCIVLGKSNMDEFAMGGTNKTSYFGPVLNPLNKSLVAGGSSGGSAAAVAGELSSFAIGTDTGGSVRQPASFCGLVGIKPSYGSISRYGISSMANTLDQVGVMGKDIKDVLLLMKEITNRDYLDSTCVGNKAYHENYNFSHSEEYLKDMRIAVPKQILNIDFDSEIKNNYQNSIKILEEYGAKVEIVDMPNLEHSIETYHLVANAEISSNMSRFDGIIFGNRAKDYDDINQLYIKSRSEGLGNEVKKRIMIGTYILSIDNAKDYYEKAMKVRTLIINDFKNVFDNNDIILMPTTPVMPFKLNENLKATDIYNADLFTTPVNLAGCGAITVPFAKSSNLSTGIQFICDRFNDEYMLKAALGFERVINNGI